jgi:branched-chain amino acid aminotransferase
MLDDAASPAIRVSDHGFTVGDGVFEAVKVVAGTPFALTRHLERLGRSAAALGLPAPDETVVRGAVHEVLEGFPEPLGRLRITYTGGEAPLGSGRGDATPTLVVAAAPLSPSPPSTTIVTVPWPRNERGALAGVKSTSYAENVVALAYAAERGASEAIFANTVGDLCEGTGTNIFYVADGELRTPTLAAGCLAGVTRSLIVEWCDAMEVDAPLEDVLRGADEVFLASTTRDAQPVHRWDDREWEVPGPVTAEVQETWARRQAEDLDP